MGHCISKDQTYIGNLVSMQESSPHFIRYTIQRMDSNIIQIEEVSNISELSDTPIQSQSFITPRNFSSEISKTNPDSFKVINGNNNLTRRSTSGYLFDQLTISNEYK